MTRHCVALRHIAFEDLGTFSEPIRNAGYRIDIIDVASEALDQKQISEADLLVVLGAPIGVYEIQAYPFLSNEIDTVRHRLARQQPTLGLCLGAQIMTIAESADVQPGRKEIGISTLNLTDIAASTPLTHLSGAPVLHWHGDVMSLPDGAELLASTDSTPVQAWSMDAYALALQFHAEADPESFEHWLLGHANEIASAGLDPIDLRAQMHEHGNALVSAGQLMITEWLSEL